MWQLCSWGSQTGQEAGRFKGLLDAPHASSRSLARPYLVPQEARQQTAGNSGLLSRADKGGDPEGWWRLNWLRCEQWTESTMDGGRAHQLKGGSLGRPASSICCWCACLPCVPWTWPAGSSSCPALLITPAAAPQLMCPQRAVPDS